MNYTSKLAKQFSGERWFPLGIGLGVVLALGLLVNSVANYFLVSQRIQTDQLRRDLADQIARLDADLQATPNHTHLAAALARAESRAAGRLAWIEVRDHTDALLARTGLSMPRTFTSAQVWTNLRARKPTFTVRQTAEGEMVIEAFVLRLPGLQQSQSLPRFQPVGLANVAAPGRPLAVVEVGAPLNGADDRLWPLRRNLLLNCSGAIALLGTLLMIHARFRSYLAGQRLEHEVSIARQVQQDLLPSPGDTSATFDLAADFQPAAHLGGDFYDAFPVSGPSGDGAAFVLGDVSGKGVPAALLTGVIHGAVRSSAWTESRYQHQHATEQLNRLLSERAASERFASLFWGYCEGETLHYINAGHLAPILMRANRPTCLRLDAGGPVLGLLPNAKYEAGSVELEPDDLIVLYSDGLVEAANANDEQFGEERVVALVAQHRHLTAAQIRDRIIRAAQTFTGGAELDDDRTVLVLRFAGVASRAQTVGSRETIHA